jgi:uncharacterized protein (UPF0332 family)
MEKSHLEQAKLWMEASRYISGGSDSANERHIVAVALAIHAILKANDAVTFRFIHATARRHDEARRLFQELVRRNLVKSEYAPYNQIIQDAINNKARAEYRIASFSKKEADEMLGKAEKFIKMAEKSIP